MSCACILLLRRWSASCFSTQASIHVRARADRLELSKLLVPELPLLPPPGWRCGVDICLVRLLLPSHLRVLSRRKYRASAHSRKTGLCKSLLGSVPEGLEVPLVALTLPEVELRNTTSNGLGAGLVAQYTTTLITQVLGQAVFAGLFSGIALGWHQLVGT